MGRGGPGGHVPLHADGVVKLHQRAGHHAVEGLDGGDFPEHAGVVQGLVKVRAALLQVRQVDVLSTVEGIGDQMVPGVLRLGLAQGDEEDGVEHRDQGDPDEGGAEKGFLVLAAEADQVHHPRQGDQGDGHIAPEAGGVVLQAKGDRLLAVGGLQGGHKADDHRNGQGDDQTPGDGALPVDALVFQGQHRGHGHHQGEHVVPPGVKGAVHHLEGGVQEGHHRHEEQNPQQLFQPVLAPQLQPANHSRHAKEGQPRPQRGPLRAGVRGEIGPGGQVRREEETAENVQVALVLVVEHGVPAVDVAGGAVVLHHHQHRGHQQHAGKPQPQHGLQGQQQEIL